MKFLAFLALILIVGFIGYIALGTTMLAGIFVVFAGVIVGIAVITCSIIVIFAGMILTFIRFIVHGLRIRRPDDREAARYKVRSELSARKTA